MANKKITQLPDADPATGSELIEVVQGGVNKKMTLLDATGVSPGVGGFADWDNTQNRFPDATLDGPIPKFTIYIGSGTGEWELYTGAGSETVNDGIVFIARVQNPANDPTDWAVL